MSNIPTIIINEHSYNSCESALKELEGMRSDEVILRCACSGIPAYKEDDLRVNMKYSLIEPSHVANRNVTFFTTIPTMTANLLKSTGEEIIEVPMGFVIRELLEVLVSDAVQNYSSTSIITSHDTRKQAESKPVMTSNYHHTMTVTRLYDFLVAVGAFPLDNTGNWSGNERVQGVTMHSNLLFRTYYRFKKMSVVNARDYISSILSGYKVEPKEYELSPIYTSQISIFQTYPMYVPIRASGKFVTSPDDVMRVVYIYDCIASYVNKMNNLTYYKVSYDSKLVGNYNYFISEFRDAGENVHEVPGGPFLRPKFKEFSTFVDFKTVLGLKVSQKFDAVAKFFRNLGRSIQLSTVGQSNEIRNIVCSQYDDPLIDFYSYREKQKSKKPRLLLDEMMDNAVVETDDMETRKKVSKEVEKRPDFDGYYEIPGEKRYYSKALGGAPAAESSETYRGRNNREDARSPSPAHNRDYTNRRGQGRGWARNDQGEGRVQGRGWGRGGQTRYQDATRLEIPRPNTQSRGGRDNTQEHGTPGRGRGRGGRGNGTQARPQSTQAHGRGQGTLRRDNGWGRGGKNE